ncbi:hypothetical protein BO79DRAFT_213049 [Aspergillus costaricaensis CBS 115574]|uniref:Uncharacterized protein n=1 Tax=Aspergillus costaricaensis CBS 115574 TaxID=1448317 RepID=A0ACD1IUJ1_9EURO|nr:hypothetical protein BO79DRAFT_213049 [Aspergillus costaricaensis CBS 115574]RAK93421.1 hypothetical protein BO79DRAFT_213049 [Aspergillus costaricaensis CBS 115574]
MEHHLTIATRVTGNRRREPQGGTESQNVGTVKRGGEGGIEKRGLKGRSKKEERRERERERERERKGRDCVCRRDVEKPKKAGKKINLYHDSYSSEQQDGLCSTKGRKEVNIPGKDLEVVYMSPPITIMRAVLLPTTSVVSVLKVKAYEIEGRENAWVAAYLPQPVIPLFDSQQVSQSVLSSNPSLPLYAQAQKKPFDWRLS